MLMDPVSPFLILVGGIVLGMAPMALVQHHRLRLLQETLDTVSKSRDQWRELAKTMRSDNATVRHHVRCLVGILGDDDDE